MSNYDTILNEHTRKGEAFPLLDSMLITPTFSKLYNVKLVDCGDYIQLYYYEKSKMLKAKDDNTDLELKKIKLNNVLDKTIQVDDNADLIDEKNIETRNIIRSKLSCQRIAKANSNKWESFITLTIGENITDVKVANKEFRYFIDKVRRVKKDFCYIAIPEFQKRGAVHYHLLTNINIDDSKLIYSQEDNPNFKHIKYWNIGFTSIEVVKDDIKKIVGYISKYMTKDIDNRLFGFRRFLYSQNLQKPKNNYIDLNAKLECNFLKEKIQDKELIYQNEYINPYDNSTISFLEFKK